MAEQETDPPHTAAGDSADERVVTSPPEDDIMLNVKDNRNPEEGSHGDYKGEMSENEQKPMTAEISTSNHPLSDVSQYKDMAEQETDPHHTGDGDSAEERVVPPTEKSSPSEDDKMLNVKDNRNPEEGSHGDYKREIPEKEQKPMTAEISTSNHPLSDVSQYKDMAEQETAPHHTGDGDLAEERVVPSPPEDDKMLNVKDNRNPEEGSHGDFKGEMPEKEQKPMTAEISKDKGQDAQSKQEKTDVIKQQLSQGEYHPEEKKAPEKTSPPTLDGKKDDHVDGPDHPEEKKAPEKTSPPTLDVKKDERVDGPDHPKEKKAPETTSPPTLDGKDDRVDGPDHPEEKKAPETTSSPTLDAKDDRVDGPDHPEVKKAPETTSPPTPDGKKDDHVDGPDEETPDSNATNTDAEEDDESCPEKEDDIQANTILTQTIEDVETIGPTSQETLDTEPAIPVVIGNRGGTLGITYLTVASLLVLVIAFLGQHLFQPKSPPQKDELRQIDIFLRELAKVKTQFPNQRAELWDRSKIHLLRHLQTAQPTEPVSLILTAGHRGERTLHCLAQRLASAFSSSLNASVLHIDGASKATQDSDQVKLDIDRKLQGAFEGDKPVAVINRFEELPPGSTLIFYRYCDHENAAYKNTFLIFTVLLGEEEEIPADTRLSTVEELVDDHLQKKFLSDGHPVSFDRMDIDKYSGLWSRISHLILPVAAEERIERKGC